MTIMPKDFFLTFIKSNKSSQKDAYSFYFDRRNSDFTFLPGQYIRMTLAIDNPDERGKSRFFSISSSPLFKDYIIITTRISENPTSFKKTLLSLISGEDVKFFGPIGRFIFNEEEKAPHVFLAGGIGITPFHSMITFAGEKNLTIPITLFVSFPTVEDIIFHNELKKIQNANSNIKIIYTLTQPQDLASSWNGETGRISQSLIKKYITDPFTSLYYIAGPPKMVEDMVLIVKEMGVLEDKIKKENFIGY